MALEAESMEGWEFDSVEQASRCISTWYSGTNYDRFILKEYLDRVSNKGDVYNYAQEDFRLVTPISNASECRSDDGFYDYFCTPPFSGPYKRRKIMKSSIEVNEVPEKACHDVVSSPTLSTSSPFSDNLESENRRLTKAANYKDVLILFWFNDPKLQFKLKEIIMSDLRLLTLLEYGLPSLVIFLQSYPVFCKIYRPWMCPLARALYVVMFVITVLIGFYDHYKNVPLLKATASHLLLDTYFLTFD